MTNENENESVAPGREASDISDLLYRVEWEHKPTGRTGHGKPISKDAAEATAEMMDAAWKHDGFHHWVAAV